MGNANSAGMVAQVSPYFVNGDTTIVQMMSKPVTHSGAYLVTEIRASVTIRGLLENLTGSGDSSVPRAVFAGVDPV
jgi:hypothetical protein